MHLSGGPVLQVCARLQWPTSARATGRSTSRVLGRHRSVVLEAQRMGGFPERKAAFQSPPVSFHDCWPGKYVLDLSLKAVEIKHVLDMTVNFIQAPFGGHHLGGDSCPPITFEVVPTRHMNVKGT